MKNRSILFLAAALSWLLAGCAGVAKQASAPSAAPEAVPGVAQPQPPAEAVPLPEPKPVMSGNRAVIALLDRAQTDTESGRPGAAGASLERALRIEPRNPWVWHELAQLRLTQGQYGQAITLAQKSISFAGRDRHLQALNWRLIGNARVAQGDSDAAERAFKRAVELEQAASD